MPTILSHPAPVLALWAGLGKRLVPMRLGLFGLAASVLPDADVIGFRFGITYGHDLGHRGFSHSLLFAVLVGLLGFVAAPLLRCKRLMALTVGFLAVASHILLDAMTTGGLGVAAFWPWDSTRYFLSWRPIRVSPFDPKIFLTARGGEVLLSEFYWVWLPCLVMAIMLAWARSLAASRRWS